MKAPLGLPSFRKALQECAWPPPHLGPRAVPRTGGTRGWGVTAEEHWAAVAWDAPVRVAVHLRTALPGHVVPLRWACSMHLPCSSADARRSCVRCDAADKRRVYTGQPRGCHALVPRSSQPATPHKNKPSPRHALLSRRSPESARAISWFIQDHSTGTIVADCVNRGVLRRLLLPLLHSTITTGLWRLEV